MEYLGKKSPEHPTAPLPLPTLQDSNGLRWDSDVDFFSKATIIEDSAPRQTARLNGVGAGAVDL
jgi:hypothetical protein